MNTHSLAVACGLAAAAAVVAFILMMAIGGVQQLGRSLDKSQAEFEADFARGRGYNFDGARRREHGMFLNCADAGETLRTCVLMLKGYDPVTGEVGGGILEPFACSIKTCAWTFTGQQ